MDEEPTAPGRGPDEDARAGVAPPESLPEARDVGRRRVLVVDAPPARLEELAGEITALIERAGCPVRHVIADDCGGSWPPVPPPDPEGEAPVAGRVMSAGDLVVCVDARVARRAGEDLDLTRIEFDLLVELLRHRSRVVTKEAIAAGVWHHEEVSANAVEARISRLRAKLERQGPRIIHTVRDVGYVLHVPADPADGGRGAVVELVAADLVLDLAPPGVPWPAGGRH